MSKGTRGHSLENLKLMVDAALQKAFWNWAGVPSGLLGWVSSRTVLWSGSYPAVVQKTGRMQYFRGICSG